MNNSVNNLTTDLANRIDRNCLSFWYPLVKDVVPCPETTIIEAGLDLSFMVDGPNGHAPPKADLDAFVARIRDAANEIGLPVFLRTGHTSAKHGWNKTCYFDGRNALIQHIYEIVEFSALADLLGLPTNVWAVRRFLHAKPAFHAFHGHMPITREFRYFVDNGEVTHRQPYWPPGAIEDHHPSLPAWRQHLKAISKLDDDTESHLAAMSVIAAQAVGGGHWSIDWLLAEGEWWLTDMADGAQSYKWTPPQTLAGFSANMVIGDEIEAAP